MASYGYGSVSAKSFIAFAVDLKDGAWAALDEAPYRSDGYIKASALTAPLTILWKLRLIADIATLQDAVGSEVITELDVAWDSAQRRLHFQLSALAEDPDAKIKDAATRLRSLLLTGQGTGQTSLDYDAEIDFGRQQRALAKEPKAAADVALLRLEDHLASAEEATDRLAAAMGRKAGQARQGAPWARQREAVAACARAFNAVHEDLAWYVEHMEKGAERDGLLGLKAPLDALLARSPAAAPKGTPVAPAPASALPPLDDDAEITEITETTETTEREGA